MVAFNRRKVYAVLMSAMALLLIYKLMCVLAYYHDFGQMPDYVLKKVDYYSSNAMYINAVFLKEAWEFNTVNLQYEFLLDWPVLMVNAVVFVVIILVKKWGKRTWLEVSSLPLLMLPLWLFVGWMRCVDNTPELFGQGLCIPLVGAIHSLIMVEIFILLDVVFPAKTDHTSTVVEATDRSTGPKK